MSSSVQALVPTEWRGAYEILSAPLAWIPDWHTAMINYAWYGDGPEMVIKRIGILLPTLLLLTAVWSTGISLYTLPFRSGRHRFLSALISAWWDAGRSTWFFWTGMVRAAILVVGWVWGVVRFALHVVGGTLRGTVRSPLIPWLAFLAMLLWTAIESLILAFVMRPTLTGVFIDIAGFTPDPRLTTPIVWVFVWFLVLGSFAGIHTLDAAIRTRRIPMIVQMVVVQLFVMAVGVVFLYSGLVGAIVPAATASGGDQVGIGLVGTLALASAAWIGVRGMTWYLFGRYGAPTLITLMAKESTAENAAKARPRAPIDLWRAGIAVLKAETRWFTSESQHAFELLSLPVLQLFAAAVNFALVPIASRPMFSLPFKSIEDALHATPRLFSTRDVSAQFRSDPQLQGEGR